MWVDSASGERFAPDKLIARIINLEGQAIVLEGPTGCGKTQLLRFMRRRTRRPMLMLTAEALKPCDGLTEAAEGYGIICIEDVDMLSNSAYRQVMAGKTLRAIAENALVVLSGIDCSNRIPALIRQLKPAVRVLHYEGTSVEDLDK